MFSLLVIALCASPVIGASPVLFSLVSDAKVLDSTWHCASLALAPEEENPQFSVNADPLFSPPSLCRTFQDDCKRCHGRHGAVRAAFWRRLSAQRTRPSRRQTTATGSCKAKMVRRRRGIERTTRGVREFLDVRSAGGDRGSRQGFRCSGPKAGSPRGAAEEGEAKPQTTASARAGQMHICQSRLSGSPSPPGPMWRQSS
jgi:hypothetical protein